MYIHDGVDEVFSGESALLTLKYFCLTVPRYDSSAHLAEETHDASDTVAKGMWAATLCAWLLSVPVRGFVLVFSFYLRIPHDHQQQLLKTKPQNTLLTIPHKTLLLVFFCMQDFDGIISAGYTNNWAAYLIQLLGSEDAAVAVLVILWVDSTCATASCFLSAQRVTFAISRDGVLPMSRYFRHLDPRNRMPVRAAYLVLLLGVAITCAVIGSTVAFSAITATATIATNFSYLIPIAARHTVGRKDFTPARFHLGRFSPVIGIVACLYIGFQFVVLLLPQVYPVTAVSSNVVFEFFLFYPTSPSVLPERSKRGDGSLRVSR